LVLNILSTKIKIKNKNKSKSRRIAQRRFKRDKKITNLKQNIPLEKALKLTKARCLTNYGFYANPEKTLQSNFNTALCAEPSPLYTQPTNLAFHKLCVRNPIPPGTKHLLGLNLNYCLASHQLPNDINNTIQKMMAYSIRTKFYLQSNSIASDSEYIKQLYKKNTAWNPPPAPNLTEERITVFE
jgi:hypothetical protein